MEHNTSDGQAEQYVQNFKNKMKSTLITLQILSVVCDLDDYDILAGADFELWANPFTESELEMTQASEIIKPNTKLPELNEVNTKLPELNEVNTKLPELNGVNTKLPVKKFESVDASRKKHRHIKATFIRTPKSYLKTVKPSTTTSAQYNVTSANENSTYNLVTTTPSLLTKFTCPEAEKASNIGPYEVPTRRDLVLLTIKTLHRLYSSYQRTTMVFLDDINKVVIATAEVEKHCNGNKVAYRQCVKHVVSKCETITKSLMASLEQQQQDIIAFGQTANTICSIEAMRADPVKLIKILASEHASLEFALPGFLRLLNACSNYCISPTSADKFKAVKPSRHLTDTDVIIRHFLTKKNYKRLLAPKPKSHKTELLTPILGKSQQNP